MANEESKLVKYLDNKVEIKGKPPKGESVAVYVRPGDKVDLQALGLDLETTKFKLVGGDIVLDVPGGGTYTFVSMALMGYSNSGPEFLGMGGKSTSLSAILSNIEEINAVPVTSVATNDYINMPEQKKEQEKAKAESDAKAAAQVIVIDNNPALQDNSNIAESIAENKAPESKTNVEEAPVNINTSTKSDDSSKTKSEDKKNDAAPFLTFDIDVQHVAKIEDINGTELTVYGGGGISYSNVTKDKPYASYSSNPDSLKNQTVSETIDYSSNTGNYSKVVIYADDSKFFDSTKISRTVILNMSLSPGYKVDSIVLSGSLPDGFGVGADQKRVLSSDDFVLSSDGKTISFVVTMNTGAKLDIETFSFDISATATWSMANYPADYVGEKNEPTDEASKSLTTKMEYVTQLKYLNPADVPGTYGFVADGSYEKDSGFVITEDINGTVTKGFLELDNTIYGGLSVDTIYGGNKNDVITGNKGNDTIYGSTGNDNIDGGDGVDWINYSLLSNGININLQTGIVTQKGNDTIQNIENVVGTFYDDIIVGNDKDNVLRGDAEYKVVTKIVDNKSVDETLYIGGDDTIYGGIGNDTIYGAAGNDTIYGGIGSDTLYGGDGINTISYDESVYTNGFTINLRTLIAKEITTGIAETDNLNEFLNVVGTKNNDTIIGNTLNNTLDGNDGNDTVDYSLASSMTINLNTGIVTGDGRDKLISIENIIGSEFDDIITGNNSDNIIFGGDGADTLSGGSGADILNGYLSGVAYSKEDYVDYSYLDTTILNGGLNKVFIDLSAAGQNATVYNNLNQATDDKDTLINIANIIGSKNDDTIYGDSFNNTIFSSAGNDTIVSGGSKGTDGADWYDEIDGGSGSDLLTYENSGLTSSLTIDLSNTSIQSTGADNIKIRNIEDASGALGSDTITGNQSNNKLSGFAGEDTLYGNSGADSLYGGEDADNLYGGTGNDLLEGESGDDILDGGTGNDKLYGGTGNDKLYGGIGSDTLIGEIGSDTLIGNSGTDTVDYTTEAAKIVLTLGANGTEATATIYGTDDLDILSEIENIQGSTFDDTISGNNLNNIIKGGLGNDKLDGGLGDDSLSGEDGNDSFIANDGIDSISGGNGIDTIDYSSRANSINVTLTGSDFATLTENGSAKDLIKDVENIIGSSANDTISGDSLANTLKGSAGDDLISAGAGSVTDYIDGGTHTIDNIGTQGSTNSYAAKGDTLSYEYLDTIDEITTGVSANLSTNRAVDMGAGTNVGSDKIYNIENLIGSKYSDSLVGDSANNTLIGADGNDILKGQGGDDNLIGGAGIDTVDYSEATEKLNINITDGTYTINASQGVDTFSGIEGAIGGSNDDTITGNTGANSLVGNAGDDTLIGGGTGTAETNEYDYIDGGDGSGDLVSYNNETTAVTINLGLTYDSLTTTEHSFNDIDEKVSFYQNAGAAGRIQIINVENLEGGFGNDILIGNDSENTIKGGAGNDTLTGKGNNDTLDGGVDEYTHKLKVDTPVNGQTYSFTIGGIIIQIVASSANASDIITQLFNKFEETSGAKALGYVAKDGDNLWVQSSSAITSITNLSDTAQAYYDTADYSSISSTSGIEVDMNLGGTDTSVIEYGQATIDSTTDNLISIENIIGSKNADRIIGDTADNIGNTFWGRAGDDFISGGAGNDLLYGEAGYDTLDGGDGDDTLDGGDGDDTLTGGAGTDTLKGGAGNDTFVKLAGDTSADIINGEGGSDTADYSASTAAVKVTLNNATAATVTIGSTASDKLSNVENIKGTSLADIITGDTQSNTLYGQGGRYLKRWRWK